jgi:hypothetical protein
MPPPAHACKTVVKRSRSASLSEYIACGLSLTLHQWLEYWFWYSEGKRVLKQNISTKQRDALEKAGPCSNGRISDPEMPQRRRVGPAQLMFHLCLMSVAFGTHGHLVQKDEALHLSNWATISSTASPA